MMALMSKVSKFIEIDAVQILQISKTDSRMNPAIIAVMNI